MKYLFLPIHLGLTGLFFLWKGVNEGAFWSSCWGRSSWDLFGRPGGRIAAPPDLHAIARYFSAASANHFS